MEQRTTVGIDLAKEVFAVCVLSDAGEVIERQRLRRTAFERWLASLPSPCIVAMEACSSAHHWGRLLAARGHTVRLIAPSFVTPFSQERQERRPRCRGDRDCRLPAHHALCRHQVRRGADHSVLAPRPPGLDRGTQRTHQSHARFAHRVRHRHCPLCRSPARRAAATDRLRLAARAAAAAAARSARTTARHRCAPGPLRRRGRFSCSLRLRRPAPAPGARHRAAYQQRVACCRRRRTRVSQRPPVQRLAWHHSIPAQLRGQDSTRSLDSARQRLPSHPARPRRSQHPAGGSAHRACQSHPPAAMDRRPAPTQGLSQDSCRHRQQARAHRLGAAGSRRKPTTPTPGSAALVRCVLHPLPPDRLFSRRCSSRDSSRLQTDRGSTPANSSAGSSSVHG